MRRAARTDGNHAEVVKALEKAGMKVYSLAAIGRGCPDLLVSWRTINCLLEIKDGSLPPSQRQLTADERNWHATWPGQVAVVLSPEEAINVVLSHAKACGVI